MVDTSYTIEINVDKRCSYDPELTRYIVDIVGAIAHKLDKVVANIEETCNLARFSISANQSLTINGFVEHRKTGESSEFVKLIESITLTNSAIREKSILELRYKLYFLKILYLKLNSNPTS